MTELSLLWCVFSAFHFFMCMRSLPTDATQPFLELNGAEVTWYASTTFNHEKYISIDGGRKISVSSINFSRTSFLRNREAGLILHGEGIEWSKLSGFFASVFDDDWKTGIPLPNQETIWSEEDLAIIRDKTPLPVVLPLPSSTWADCGCQPS